MVDSTNLPEININQIVTDLNGKMDRDGVNATCPVVISRTANNYGGVVEIWTDGYCVQTGNVQTPITDTPYTISLSQTYANTDYNIFLTTHGTGTQMNITNAYGDKTTSSFKIWLSHKYNSAGTPQNTYWRTEGYIR